MGNPSDQGPRRWDAVCVSVITLATVVLVALFTLVGFADEVLNSDRFRAPVIISGATAIGAYFSCLILAFNAIFNDDAEQQKSRTQDAAVVFIFQVVAVVVVAAFVVWAKL